MTSTWQGGASGAWNEPANWSPSSNFPNNDSAKGPNTYSAIISTASVSLASDLALDALRMNGSTLSGPHTIILGFGRGTFSGTNQLSAQTQLQLGSLLFTDDSASLTNHGILRFKPSLSYIASNATLTNASGGVIRPDTSTDTQIGAPGTAPFTLINHGTLLSDKHHAVAIHTPIIQSASGLTQAIQNQSNLYFSAGGTVGGTLQADAASAQITLFGPDRTYTLAQTTILGEGGVSAVETTLTGTLASGRLTLDHTTLSGSFVNQTGGTLVWDDGTRFANDSATLVNHGTLLFSTRDLNSYFPSGATLTNASSGVIRFDPVTLDPDSVVHIGLPDVVPFALVNQGTLLSQPGSRAFHHVPVASTGLVHITDFAEQTFHLGLVQTSGELRIEDGVLNGASGQALDFRGGLLRAHGIIVTNGAAFTLADTVLEFGSAENPGSLAVYGNLTLLAGSTTRFDLAAPDSHGTLSADGTITLGGELVIRLAPGLAASLTPDHAFTLVSATTLQGSFANVQNGRRLTLADGSASFVVTVTGTEATIGRFATSPFVAFLMDAGLAAANHAPEADPDGDGMSNLLEFALGGDPAVAASAPRPAVQAADGALSLSYRRARPDIAYLVQTTADLEIPSAWTAIGVNQGTPEANGDTVATVPLGGARRFLRLQVALIP